MLVPPCWYSPAALSIQRLLDFSELIPKESCCFSETRGENKLPCLVQNQFFRICNGKAANQIGAKSRGAERFI